ncbi:MAG UNVERIFIED_CONTAM: hypothetical protein LVR29_07030 [Microcystis novacekii LVE1205-3]|jgi:hypothetical protein
MRQVPLGSNWPSGQVNQPPASSGGNSPNASQNRVREVGKWGVGCRVWGVGCGKWEVGSGKWEA